MLFAFKIFLLPVPTRPGTRPFLQVPDPSRPEVKNPYPSDPALKVKWWKQKRGGGRCHKSVVKSAEVRTKSSKNSGFVGRVPDLKRHESVLFYPFAVLIICLLLFC